MEKPLLAIVLVFSSSFVWGVDITRWPKLSPGMFECDTDVCKVGQFCDEQEKRCGSCTPTICSLLTVPNECNLICKGVKMMTGFRLYKQRNITIGRQQDAVSLERRNEILNEVNVWHGTLLACFILIVVLQTSLLIFCMRRKYIEQLRKTTQDQGYLMGCCPAIIDVSAKDKVSQTESGELEAYGTFVSSIQASYQPAIVREECGKHPIGLLPREEPIREEARSLIAGERGDVPGVSTWIVGSPMTASGIHTKCDNLGCVPWNQPISTSTTGSIYATTSAVIYESICDDQTSPKLSI